MTDTAALAIVYRQTAAEHFLEHTDLDMSFTLFWIYIHLMPGMY